MRVLLLNIIFTFFCLGLAVAGIVAFATVTVDRQITYSLPGMDGSDQRTTDLKQVTIGEHFQEFAAQNAASDSAPWPSFRGPARDNIVLDGPELAHAWPAGSPPVLWRVDLGEGYAGPAIAYQRVYLLDYLEQENADALRCFALLDGTELWRRFYHNPIRRNHGKSRTVPAIAHRTVVTLGPMAHVMAANAISGELLWTRDLPQEDGSEIPQWYTGQCPLIDDDQVILAPAGSQTLLLAVALRTGEVLWQLPNQIGLKMSHSSVIIATLNGVRQYIYAGIGGIIGVDMNGELLWHAISWLPPVWAPTPVQVADDRLFLTAGYGMGSALLQVTNTTTGWQTTLLSKWKPTQGAASEQQTPIFINGVLFTIQPKDAGNHRAQMVAANPEKMPAMIATSGREWRFGLGPYLFADQKMWIMDDDGRLTAMQFKEQQFVHLGTWKVLPGVDSWGPIALADGLMVVRDATSMACLKLTPEKIADP